MKTIKIKGILDIPRDFTGITEIKDGSKFWYQNGKLHRDNDEPAIEFFDGAKAWYIDGQLARATGPTIVYPDGTKIYHVNGAELTEKQFEIFSFMWENTVKEKTQELMDVYIRLAIVKDRQI